MKRNALVVTGLLVLSVLLAGQAFAETFTYVPSPADCWDLDHSYYYTWGIDVSGLQGLNITEVELVIENITNWDNNTNVLYLHLLDNAPLGLTSHSDSDNAFVDPFGGEDGLIDAFTDTNGSATTQDLHYLFSDLGLVPMVKTYAADGVIGIGIDPDCHYWNDGITLIITAECQSSATKKETWGQIKNQFKEEE
jgi:hypothetical protein